MTKPLIGLDLDGVVAIEDRDKYFKCKSEGISSLHNYYDNLVPDYELIREVFNNLDKYRFNIYTARKNDIPNIQYITKNWLCKQGLNYLVDKTVFTKFRWKLPELILNNAIALIDNDWDNLSKCWGKQRIAYKPYFKGRRWGLRPTTDINLYTRNPKEIFAYLDKVCYTKK